ncbi:hypothetical protein [Chondrinema litorale]|uniref:hypothetical protein n=1 Tax=Chondrinema litorale TaxID=2994555 RepID=UPI002543957D|nr:hypothetical protein [Chondrinema litorale]UZS00125.1 hypothetical protein OQ292_39905 [Chondrinema litorale]
MAKRKDINIFDQSRKVKETKRVSDMDYLDAFEEPPVRKKEEVVEPKLQESAPEETFESKKKERGKKDKEWVRYTFIIKPENLEELKDIVHTIKSTGDYQYSQKQALDDAIKLLKAQTQKRIGEIKKFKG